MSRDPTNIRRREKYIPWFAIKNGFRSVACVYHVSTERVNDSFRLSSRSRGMEDKNRIIGT